MALVVAFKWISAAALVASSLTVLKSSESFRGQGNLLEKDPSRYDEKIALDMVGYAAVVTCGDPTVLEEWNCKFCRKGDGAIRPPPPLVNVTVLKSGDNINQAFVGFDAVNRRIVCSFRGSISLSQWIFDLDVELVQKYNDDGCHNCLVHEGFYDAYEELSHGFLRDVLHLANVYDSKSIWITGHSLGAAMAAHGALSLHSLDPTFEITGYTFGQPRIGNEHFANWAHKSLPNWIRIVNYEDPVVQCVKLPGYFHMPREVWYYEKPQLGKPPGDYVVCSATNGEDRSCQNSKCGGFKLCLNGDYHVSYMNIHGVTNVSMLC